MRKLGIINARTTIQRLQNEIRKSRYEHRLHGVLLVAQGMSCPAVSRMLGTAPRTIEYWVQRFESRGVDGLSEDQRSGRPRRLSEAQLKEIEHALRRTPRNCGIKSETWNGKTLANWIAKRFRVRLGVRQCQRLIRDRGLRPQK